MGSGPTGSVTALDIDGNTHEIPLSELSWRPSAYGIVIKDGNLLLTKQPRGYDLPGGGIDFGERPEAAVIREIKEETGIDVTAGPRLLAAASTYFKFTHTDGEAIQSIMLYYACDHVSGDLGLHALDEYEAKYSHPPEWYPLDKLDELKVASSNDFRPIVRQMIG